MSKIYRAPRPSISPLVFVWMAALTAGLFWARGGGVRRFDELTVGRLNVVEPDGKPRVIISNAVRFPGIYWDGREYRHVGREKTGVPRGGFLFYNDEGTEAGGMLFTSTSTAGRQAAASSLLFDQHRQDQVMGLQYSESDGKRQAGLRVWDQPDSSLLPLIQLSDRAARASTPAEREAVLAQMTDAGRNMGRFSERFFAGKAEGDAIVKLSDKEGRPRLILKVDDAGKPSVEFLDAAGKVIKRVVP